LTTIYCRSLRSQRAFRINNQQTNQQTDMADSTHSGVGGDNLGPSNNPTPTSSRAATPGADGRQTPAGLRTWAKKKYDKGKARVERGIEKGKKKLFDRGPKRAGEMETRPQDAGGSGASGMGDDASFMGGLQVDTEAAAAGGTGAVDELIAGAPTTKTPNADKVLSNSAELETGQEEAASSSQLQAPSASAAKDENTALPKTLLASLVPKQEDRAATTHGIEDALTLFNQGSRASSGAVPLGNSLATAELTELEPDTTGSAAQARGAETVPLSIPDDDLLSVRPQAMPTLVAAGDGRPLPEAPVSAAENNDDAHNVPETLEGQIAPATRMARSPLNESELADDTEPSKVWAIAKGTLKTALVIAATLIPEPFKGPADALLKVVEVVEVCVYFTSVSLTLFNPCIENQF
jgi:hypothetical protein